jgi:hypothetical protein
VRARERRVWQRRGGGVEGLGLPTSRRRRDAAPADRDRDGVHFKSARQRQTFERAPLAMTTPAMKR